MNTLIDTHCHITCDALYERIDEVLENCKAGRNRKKCSSSSTDFY